MKNRILRAGFAAAGLIALLVLSLARVAADTVMPSNDYPDPYAKGVGFGQLPEGRQ
jgi:hypothetical protein